MDELDQLTRGARREANLFEQRQERGKMNRKVRQSRRINDKLVEKGGNRK